MYNSEPGTGREETLIEREIIPKDLSSTLKLGHWHPAVSEITWTGQRRQYIFFHTTNYSYSHRLDTCMYFPKAAPRKYFDHRLLDIRAYSAAVSVTSISFFH